MKALAYIRVSTQRQAEKGHSLSAQEKAVQSYAESHDLDLIGVYRDGSSGRTTDRAGLDAMRQRVAEGDIDRVIVFSLSRFGRSVRDTFNLVDEFEAHGTHLIFLEPMVMDLSEDNHLNTILLSLLSALAQVDSETKAVAVRAGMAQSASQNRWQGGPTPFGYLLAEDGTLDPDPVAADTITEMADMILEGRSTQEVADHLNAIGFAPPRGGQWKSAEVRRHLRRESLKGEARWGDIEISFEPILDPAIWDRLQSRLDQTSLPRQRSGDTWTLSGRVTCSCGGTLVGAGRRRGTRYYRCSNHKGDQKGECQCDHDEAPFRPRWYKADDIERAAWEEFVWTLHRKDLLDEAIDRHLGHNDNGFDEDTFRKVSQTAETVRNALIQAEADLYTAEDKERHQAVVENLRSRLRTAEKERDRLAEIRANQSRATELRQKWLEVADTYVTFDGTDMPDADEQKDIYADLDVRWDLLLRPRYSGRVAYKARGWDPEVDRAWLPLMSYLQCSGLTLPSEVVYTANRTVRPSAASEQLPVEAGRGTE